MLPRVPASSTGMQAGKLGVSAHGANTTEPVPLSLISSPVPGPIPPGPDTSPHQLFRASMTDAPMLTSPLAALLKNELEVSAAAPSSHRPSPPFPEKVLQVMLRVPLGPSLRLPPVELLFTRSQFVTVNVLGTLAPINPDMPSPM